MPLGWGPLCWVRPPASPLGSHPPPNTDVCVWLSALSHSLSISLSSSLSNPILPTSSLMIKLHTNAHFSLPISLTSAVCVWIPFVTSITNIMRSMIWAPPMTVRIKEAWPGQSTRVNCNFVHPPASLRRRGGVSRMKAENPRSSVIPLEEEKRAKDERLGQFQQEKVVIVCEWRSEKNSKPFLALGTFVKSSCGVKSWQSLCQGRYGERKNSFSFRLLFSLSFQSLISLSPLLFPLSTCPNTPTFMFTTPSILKTHFIFFRKI